jgi:hypothetical protein
MTFQGRLTKPDGTPVADGTYTVHFSLHDALTGGTAKWSQTLNNVAVRNGTFAALLDVNTAHLFNGDLYLEIKIGSDAPLTPRQPLVSVPYALKANTVPDGSIAADKLANDALNNLSWLLGGNTSTNPTSHFLGTTDSQPLAFRTNNVERLRIDSAGNLGIGTDTPGAKLDVRGAGAVNVFAGDLSPFGQSAYETNFSTAQTHAWFAENGNRVFSVTVGGVTTTGPGDALLGIDLTGVNPSVEIYSLTGGYSGTPTIAAPIPELKMVALSTFLLLFGGMQWRRRRASAA